MPFLYEKTEYRGEDCIEITGSTSETRSLTIPDTIEEMPVRSIGRHAFAARNDLQEISLPPTMKRLCRFAFHNCRNLRKIRLYDSVEDYYDGAVRQCGALSEIELVTDGSSFALMKEMLEGCDHAVSFYLRMPSEDIRLSFPEFALIASENTMARTIQFAYEGGGYAYRQCVRKKGIRFREYDRLFPFMEHDDPSFAAVIAADRLLYPHDLDAAAEERYTAFLRAHAAEALDRFIRDSKIDQVRLITQRGLADEEAVSRALEAASLRKETAICAVLMESGRQLRETKGGPRSSALELDDW